MAHILYHITWAQNWENIKKEGLIPRKSPPMGQYWTPHFNGTYFFVYKWQAEDNLEDCLRLDPYCKRSDIAIIKATIPYTPEWNKRMRPDEDWSRNSTDWINYKNEGSVVVLGTILPRYLKRVD